jgi:hypothetical protein
MEVIITPEETTHIRAMLGNPDRRFVVSTVTLLSTIATCRNCGARLVSVRHACGSGGTGRDPPRGSTTATCPSRHIPNAAG